MIVDTSAWIEYFQGTDSLANHRIYDSIRDDAHIVVPELVMMELSIGTTDEAAAARRKRFLRRFDIIPIAPLRDTEAAATIHRRCRRSGETVRNLIDCTIAAVAIRLGYPVLHRDRDFSAIARHTRLKEEPAFDR
ncbi:PIN domain nuclease [Saxibacter everestensis]|uniref:Ribonuclease VapC n=1 Tax=Saxibacter everestensis TaxID=2909229 RepID=A0ABY8QQI8_9MICO|nr:PIN domain nuclease [Brevibacteriaceae bacterium ZFBP1038]